MITRAGMFMSHKESVRYQIAVKFNEGRITRNEASRILGCSERSITRLASKIDEQLGIVAVKHGNLGRSARNSVASEIKTKTLNLIRKQYFDLNVSHIKEVLEEKHGIIE